MSLPDELNSENYKHCDFETRININHVYKWNFRIINPYFDYTFKETKRTTTTTGHYVYSFCM
jgi:hypothetical protein